MKKKIIYIISFIIVVSIITIIFISSQNNDIEQSEFEYTISDVTTSELDIALQNYTKSYYNEDNKLDGEYASNIKNNQALADDPIVNFIPREYFTNIGSYNCFDIDYGYYISTKQLADDSYSSVVIMFDILFYTNTSVYLGVKPLFSNEYRTIPINDRYNSIIAIGDGAYNNVVIPNIDNNTDYKITNLEIEVDILNICYLNETDEGYDSNSDEGNYITSILSSTLTNSEKLFVISETDIAKEYSQPMLYYNNNHDYSLVSSLKAYKLEQDYSIDLFNIKTKQLDSYGQLIKGIKSCFNEDYILNLNKTDYMPYIQLSLNDSNNEFDTPSNINFNIAFDILDTNNKYVDSIESKFLYEFNYNGILEPNIPRSVSMRYNVFTIKNVETGNYKIKAHKTENSISADIDTRYYLFEIIENKYANMIDIENNIFYLEAGKEYIIDIYYFNTDKKIMIYM
ncbi:MAG: hypothetical protein IJY14_01110 [Acholeplasmatales bacterium]|nr:hypothetical protein [Acholeplasmatales bacterium]